MEKVLHGETIFSGKNLQLIVEQGITMVSILSAIFMTILTIVLAIVGVFKGGVPVAFSLLPRKDEKALKTWLNS